MKKILSILLVFMMLMSLVTVASAKEEIKNVRWGEDKNDATYLYFDIAPNVELLCKFNLYKDGKEVARYVESYESSDGTCYVDLWGFIKHFGYGSYTAFVEGTTDLWENFDEYIERNAEEDIPMQIKSSFSNKFVYDSPFQYRGEGSYAYPVEDYWEHTGFPVGEYREPASQKPQNSVVNNIIATTVPPIESALPTPEIVKLTDLNNELFTVVEEVEKFDVNKLIPTIKNLKIRAAYTPVDSYNLKGDVNSYGEVVEVNHKYYDGYTAKDILGLCFINSSETEEYYKRGIFSKTSANASEVYFGVNTYYNYGYVQLFSETEETYFACYNPFNNKFYMYPGEMSAIEDDGTACLKDGDKVYKVQFNPTLISVLYNGEKIGFDQLPVIENGRTLVPLRAIFEKLGADIDWNEDTKTVTATKEDVTISLVINSTTAIKNGVPVTLDVPAKTINDRTVVPVRFISECFGVNVDWNENTQSVIITSN